MNTKFGNIDDKAERGAEGASQSARMDARRERARVGGKPKPPPSGKTSGKSKKDQLVALLSKPNGARISSVVDRLGWQAHTVRAALSGLRKQGHEIATTKSPKTGGTVYSIVAPNAGKPKQSGEGAAS